MKTSSTTTMTVALLWASATFATPPPEATSLNTCQAQVKTAAKAYVDGYVSAVATCLQAISMQIVQKNADGSAAASTCATQFRNIYDRRGAGKSLKEKLTAAIDKKCAPGGLNVTHTLGDILGPGPGVPHPLEVENIEAWCANFGGSGTISTLDQWTDCVAASHACGALQTIATQYPLAVEWLGDVRPYMLGLTPPKTDLTKIADAVAGLDEVVAEMDPGNTGQAAFQCGDNGQLATCTTSLNTCNSNYSTCTTSLNTCTTSLTSCNGNLATVNAGTAAIGDVLSGKTFSSRAGLDVTGTMPNKGAVTITPGTTDQAIEAGYHNGSGKVLGDPDLVPGNIVSGVNIFDVVGTQPPSQLLKTGQTTSYGPGSDGDLQKGDARSYTDNGDGTITDNKTGLMWEKKDQVAGGIHNWATQYTWSGASYLTTNLMDGAIATTFLATLNAGSGFAGHTDWRIPNRFELESLMNMAGSIPAVDAAFNTSCQASCTVDGAGGTTKCSCTSSGQYWTSTTSLAGANQAYSAHFGNGAIQPQQAKNLAFYVRAVRGGL